MHSGTAPRCGAGYARGMELKAIKIAVAGGWVSLVALDSLFVDPPAATHWLVRGLSPPLYRRMDPATAGTVGFLIRLATIGVTLLIALRIAGIQPQTLAVGGAFTAVVLGLAAQQTLGNVIAGTVLLSARPFRVGERIRLQALPHHERFLGRILQLSISRFDIQYAHLDVKVAGNLLVGIGEGIRFRVRVSATAGDGNRPVCVGYHQRIDGVVDVDDCQTPLDRSLGVDAGAGAASSRADGAQQQLCNGGRGIDPVVLILARSRPGATRAGLLFLWGTPAVDKRPAVSRRAANRLLFASHRGSAVAAAQRFRADCLIASPASQFRRQHETW